ncbi:hypothetical protein Q8A73_016296 [Channa argus]|nr:hypothetical protein Q8A73_016296 [Channa argus]
MPCAPTLAESSMCCKALLPTMAQCGSGSSQERIVSTTQPFGLIAMAAADRFNSPAVARPIGYKEVLSLKRDDGDGQTTYMSFSIRGEFCHELKESFGMYLGNDAQQMSRSSDNDSVHLLIQQNRLKLCVNLYSLASVHPDITIHLQAQHRPSTPLQKSQHPHTPPPLKIFSKQDPLSPLKRDPLSNAK